MKEQNTKILVVGGTGVIGRRLIPALLRQNYTIGALATDEKGLRWLQNLGVKSYLGNILDAEATQQMLHDFSPDIIMHQATDLKQMSSEANARIRKDGTRILINACQAAGVQKIIAQSIAWAYTPGNSPALETDSLDLSAVNGRKMTVEGVYKLETAVKEIQNHVLLRYGALYGPDTWYDNGGAIFSQYNEGTAKISRGINSFLHIDDAVNAAVEAVNWPNGIYNVVDDEPVAGNDFADYYASILQVRKAFTLLDASPWERGASNAKLKQLGYKFRVPSWRDGLRYLSK